MKQILYLLAFLATIFIGACTEGKMKIDEKEAKNKVLNSPSITLLHKMQGQWTDSSHEDAYWEINGNHVNAYYKDILKVYTIETFDELPPKVEGKGSGKGIGFFVTTEETGSYCYELISLKNYQMHYEPIGPIVE